MSRFFGSVEGSRGPASRTGSNFITGHIRGWNVGVEVVGKIGADGCDEFLVYMTGGSGDPSHHDPPLARLSLDADGNPVLVE